MVSLRSKRVPASSPGLKEFLVAERTVKTLDNECGASYGAAVISFPEGESTYHSPPLLLMP